MVVDSAEEAYRRLRAAGVDATPVEDMGWGLFTFFSDPDGNKWAVQQLPKYD
ncbi:Glyoxalase-like domain [Mycobacteroides abscessus subsp. abscessus]|nr:Glyoxalase-like domain [Mycobacteroides abscessus subsp. abscessus]